MEATNYGTHIEIKADFVEAAVLVEVMNTYLAQNPNAIDADIVSEMSKKLSNPQVKIRK